MTLARTSPPHKTAARPASRPAARRKRKRKLPSPSLFQWAGIEAAPRAAAPRQFDQRLIIRLALAMWRAGDDPRGSMLVDHWCVSQSLQLPDEICGDVVRFHPSLKLGDHRAPALMWLLRDVFTDAPVAIQRVYLSEDGNVIARRTIGRLYSAAIKLDADENVTEGLHIATLETAVAAMSHGYRPMWALAGANGLADFPVLNGIEALTVIGDADDDSTQTVAARWLSAGREVIVKPP